MSCGIRVRPNAMSDALKQDIARIGELWNEGLSRFGGAFLAGANFTAVDAFFAPVAFRVQTYGLQLEGQAMTYVARLLALPAMQSWYKAGLAETWREPDHEREAAEAGMLLQDLRAKPAA